MDVYSLLGKKPNDEPDDVGMAMFRLLKCYDFCAMSAEDELEEEVLRQKLDAVDSMTKDVNMYVPGEYHPATTGVSKDYFEILSQIERDSSLQGMQAVIERLSRCLQAFPGSVLYSTLTSVLLEHMEKKN